MRCGSLLAFILALCVAAPARAAVIYVGTSGSDVAGCGATVLTPCATISKAVSAAANGDTIRVGPGRFGVDEPPLGGGIAVKKPLTFEGAQAGVDPRDPAVRTPAGPAETVLYDSNPDTKAGGLLASICARPTPRRRRTATSSCARTRSPTTGAASCSPTRARRAG